MKKGFEIVLFCLLLIMAGCQKEELDLQKEVEETELNGLELLDTNNPLISDIIGNSTKSGIDENNVDLQYPWLLNLETDDKDRLVFCMNSDDDFIDRKKVYVKDGDKRFNYIIERAYVYNEFDTDSELSPDSIAVFTGIITFYTSEYKPFFSYFYSKNKLIGSVNFQNEINKFKTNSTKTSVAAEETINGGLLEEAIAIGEYTGGDTGGSTGSDIWFISNSGRYTTYSGGWGSTSGYNYTNYGGGSNSNTSSGSSSSSVDELPRQKQARIELAYLRKRGELELSEVLSDLLYNSNIQEEKLGPVYVAIHNAYLQLQAEYMIAITTAFAESLEPLIQIALFEIGGEIGFKLLSQIVRTTTLPFKVTNTISLATSESSNFFKGTNFSEKVLQQMNNADDLVHNFPLSVDVYATRYGQWSSKIGGDGTMYQWLEMEGTWGGKNGIFEFTKDLSGKINHRYFKIIE